jgi:hypothetical protein
MGGVAVAVAVATERGLPVRAQQREAAMSARA